MQKQNLLQQHLSNHKHFLLLYVFVGLIQSCTTFLLLISIGEFFTVYFNSDNSKARILQLLGIHLQNLTSFFLFFFFLILIKSFADFLERWLSYKQGELYVKHIREKLFVTQINWSQEKFTQKHFGKYLLRYTNDMKSVQNYLTKGIMGCVKDVLFLLIGFALLYIIHHILALYLLIFILIILIIVFLVSGLQKKFISNSRVKRSSLLAFVTRSFQRHNSINLKKRVESTQQRFMARSENLYQANMHNNRFDSMLQALLPFLQFSVVGLLLWRITLFTGSINSNEALIFVLITLMIMSPIKRVLQVPAVINKGKISQRKIDEILNAAKLISEDIENPI